MEEKLEPHLAHMVLQGNDGWLFLANDTNRVIDQITGRLSLSEQDLEAWRMTIALRTSWLAHRGTKYLFSVAPAKEVVFDRHLPDGVTVSAERPVRQLQDTLLKDAGPPFVYCESSLKLADSYSCTDTHWHDAGGLIQAEALLNALRGMGFALPDLSRLGIGFQKAEWYGDLGRKLTPPQKSTVLRKKMERRAASVTFDSQISNTGSVVLFKNEDTSLPVGMIFADSFGGVGSVCDYLAQQFSKLVVLWQPHFDFRLIESVKPDVVISQIAERFLVRIPDDIRSEKLSAMKGFREKWDAKGM